MPTVRNFWLLLDICTRDLITSEGKIIVHRTNPPTAPATMVFKKPISSFDCPGLANNSLVPEMLIGILLSKPLNKPK